MHLLLTCLLFTVVRGQWCFQCVVWSLVVATSAALPLPSVWVLSLLWLLLKGPSREGQSPPEHGLHVLGSDRLCHGYSQQARPARHPAPSLPWSRGKTLVGTTLLIHPVQLHPGRTWGQQRRHRRQITLHTTALHKCPYQISTRSNGVVVKITTSTEHGAKSYFDVVANSCS